MCAPDGAAVATADRDPKRPPMLGGAPVFRDLGDLATRDGRRVRKGVIFRSCALVELTEVDVELLLQRMHVRTLVDLRDGREVAGDGIGLLSTAAKTLAYHNIPLLDILVDRSSTYGQGLVGRYLQFVAEGAPKIVRVLSVIALPSALPVVFYCTAGKDRTGVVAALLLVLLGVRPEEIVEDYCASAHEEPWLREFLNRRSIQRHRLGDIPPEYLRADPAVMREFLTLIEADAGGVERLLIKAGASPALFDALKNNLLTPLARPRTSEVNPDAV
jgi:protein-tyrosine phosphatase